MSLIKKSIQDSTQINCMMMLSMPLPPPPPLKKMVDGVLLTTLSFRA